MKRESLLAITINYIILALLLAMFGDGYIIILSIVVSALVSVCIADWVMNMIVDYRDGLFDIDD